MEPALDEKRCQIALTKIEGVGHKTLKLLVAYCGGASEVFEASRRTLKKIPNIQSAVIPRILRKDGLDEADQELEVLAEKKIEAVFFTDSDYPKRLLHYPDCPVLLYKKGVGDLNEQRILSIVGTRKPSEHGLAFCERIVRDLEKFQPVIVSGMAFGIDICAHRQALQSGLHTIGVMANGIGKEYPYQHRGTARRITGQGALITEFPPGVEAEREFFPMRNRIIAGLCDGLLVVETAARGGSMISADLANGYHKEVFAVPGMPGRTTSAGCNLLIKSHRARLVDSARDIAQALGWTEEEKEGKQKTLFEALDPESQNVLNLLSGTKPIHIDELSLKAKKPTGELAAILLDLECKSLLKSLPGNRYTKV